MQTVAQHAVLSAAQALYDSLQQILAFPDDTVLWMCHDYQPDGRPLETKPRLKT